MHEGLCFFILNYAVNQACPDCAGMLRRFWLNMLSKQLRLLSIHLFRFGLGLLR
jgi:hypothetical protein